MRSETGAGGTEVRHPGVPKERCEARGSVPRQGEEDGQSWGWRGRQGQVSGDLGGLSIGHSYAE